MAEISFFKRERDAIKKINFTLDQINTHIAIFYEGLKILTEKGEITDEFAMELEQQFFKMYELLGIELPSVIAVGFAR
jgi:hypothetical protein